MFDLTREENIKKTRKAITHTVDILKLWNILKYSIHRAVLKWIQKGEKVILLILEIMWNYCRIESS